MHLRQTPEQRLHHGNEVVLGTRPALLLPQLQERRQRQAVVILHHQVRGAVRLEQVQAVHHVAQALEPHQVQRLLLEPPQTVVERLLSIRPGRAHRQPVPVPARHLGRQVFLQGHVPCLAAPVADQVVPRQIDDAEPAAAQLRLDGEVAHHRPGRQRVQGMVMRTRCHGTRLHRWTGGGPAAARRRWTSAPRPRG